jgi:hypothetical protein
MTTDDIIRMAREVNLWDTFDDDSSGKLGKYVVLQRFAALVAAAEREECASLIEKMGMEDYGTLAIAVAVRKNAPARPERVWKGLTTAEVKALWNVTKKPSEFADLLQAKLRERNA